MMGLTSVSARVLRVCKKGLVFWVVLGIGLKIRSMWI